MVYSKEIYALNTKIEELKSVLLSIKVICNFTAEKDKFSADDCKAMLKSISNICVKAVENE